MQEQMETLVVAVSSRALFDLEQSNAIFQGGDTEGYIAHQKARERETLQPGVAFPLVRKLLALKGRGENLPRIEVILLSRNNADAGLRILNSIEAHGLDIRRAAFTTGRSPYPYARAFGAHLFLSAHEEDVKAALGAGIAAATVLPTARPDVTDEIRVAFDGDAVLFSDASERVYKTAGLEAFRENETLHAEVPMEPGPFAHFLRALHQVQQAFSSEQAPIRTALMTARGMPSHKRVINTLRAWGVRIDEILFLDGEDKGGFLAAFQADIFFDDQRKHVESAGRFVNSAHVAAGVANE